MNRKFYITTAIDYVNSLPHIGTAYEKLGADVLARFKRLDGFDVHFQMGNDEHSINVQKAAAKLGLDTKTYCNQMREGFEKTWQRLEISYDDFIQTSEPRHATAVQEIFKKIYDHGDIHKSSYEGWYCESCEAFYTEKDLVDGICPNHKTKPTLLKEENYFFALSKYQQKLLDHIKAHPEFIQPEYRRNEIIRLIEGGLDDISVSRSTFDWGIPLPIDEKHVVYVWFDALINYITAVGYPNDGDKFSKWWPADVHMIGKDITRFHCVIWPAMLMSAGVELPKTVFAHGFVYLKGEKMSKSLGNVLTPFDVIDKYGPDPLRYYLLRDAPFGRDADFTWEHFIERYNAELANGIGNLLNRTLGMVTKYLDGKIICPKESIDASDEKLRGQVLSILDKVRGALDYTQNDLEFNLALSSIWEGVAATDRYINENPPWELNKKGNRERVAAVLGNVAESLRILAILLAPFVPSTAAKIWNQLGLDTLGEFSKQSFVSTHKWGGINKEISIRTAEAIFPRIEKEEKEVPVETKKPAPVKEKKAEENKMTELIDIADFARVDLRIAEVKTAERVEGADKLLKLQISLGSEERQIVAGIAKHYTPEELVGKKIVVVANLKPAKLRGIESQGMLLAASDEENCAILMPLKDVAVGSKVK